MERPQKMAKVNNMAPAEVQITVKQLLREAKERDLEIQAQQQQQQQVTAQKKQAAAQAQQQQKEQQQQQQQQHQLQQQLQSHVQAQAQAQQQQQREQQQNIIQQIVVSGGTTPEEQQQNAGQLQLNSVAFTVSSTTTPAGIAATTATETAGTTLPDSQDALAHHESHPGHDLHDECHSGAPVKHSTRHSLCDQHRSHSVARLIAVPPAKPCPSEKPLKRFEEGQKENYRERMMYKYALDHLPKDRTQELFNSYTIHDKKYDNRNGIEDVIVSKRKYQYEQEVAENPLLAPHRGGGRARPDPRDLEAEDAERTRHIYITYQELIPHKQFTFSKLWLLYAQFEIRYMELQRVRKALDLAIGMYPRVCVFCGYIDLEIQLREFERCRLRYEEFLEFGPQNCVTWMKFDGLENFQGNMERSSTAVAAALFSYVNNMAPAEVQITVKQLLREAKERDLEIQAQQQQQQQVTAQKKQAAAQAQQQQKEQQQQQQQQHQLQQQLQSHVQAQAQAQQQQQREQQQNIIQQIVVSGGTTPEEQQQNAGQLQLNSVAFTVSSTTTPAGIAATTATETAGTTLPDSQDALAHHESHPGHDLHDECHSGAPVKHSTRHSLCDQHRSHSVARLIAVPPAKPCPSEKPLKRFEEGQKENYRERMMYKYALDHLPKDRTQELFNSYTIHDKKYDNRDGIEDVIVSKRKYQYEQEVAENPLLAPHRGGGRARPDPRDLEAEDAERTRHIYITYQELIPHKQFTFSKLWLLYAQFEIRYMELQRVRKALDLAIGMYPRVCVFCGYIDLEIQLREFERCRLRYEEFLEFGPQNCVTWMKFDGLENFQGNMERSSTAVAAALFSYVNNMAPAEVQITVKQLLREAKERDLEIQAQQQQQQQVTAQKKQAAAQAQQQQKEQQQQQQQQHQLQQQLQSHVQAQAQAQQQQQREQQQNIIQQIVVSGGTTPEEQQQNAGQLQLNSVAFTVSSTTTPAGIAATTATETAGTTLPDSQDALAHHESHPGHDLHDECHSGAPVKHSTRHSLCDQHRSHSVARLIAVPPAKPCPSEKPLKRFEEGQKENYRERMMYKYALDHLPKDRTQELFNSYTIHDKKYDNRDGIEDVIVSKRKYQYEQEVAENPLLAPHRGGGRARPDPRDLEAEDAERTRHIYITYQELIPHKQFTFSKLWLLYAQFEIRYMELQRVRKALDLAIGMYPRVCVFCGYIDLEIQLREFERCRLRYEEFLEFGPQNCVTWMKIDGLENFQGNMERSSTAVAAALFSYVNNMAPAEVQITVKQLLREAKERDLEIQAQQQQQQQVTAQKKQAAAQAQQQQKEQQQQQQQQHQLQQQLQSHVQAQAQAQQQQQREQQQNIIQQIVVSGGTTPEEQQQNAGQLQLNSVAFTVSSTTTPAGIAATTATETAGTTLPDSQDALAHHESHPGHDLHDECHSGAPVKHSTRHSLCDQHRSHSVARLIAVPPAKPCPSEKPLKRFEEGQKENYRERMMYKYALDHLPKDRTQELFNSYTIHDKKYDNRDGIEDVIVSKRKYQYEQEVAENPLLAPHRGGGRARPDPRDLEAEDAERTRHIYITYQELIPHKQFTFSKLWLLYAQFEIRYMELQRVRKALDLAIGMYPRVCVFCGYIDLEIQLREFERCRLLYEEFLEFGPQNCVTWMKFAELENFQGNMERSSTAVAAALFSYVNNMAPAAVQITAKQLLREAKERDLEIQAQQQQQQQVTAQKKQAAAQAQQQQREQQQQQQLVKSQAQAQQQQALANATQQILLVAPNTFITSHQQQM
ncbi:hypothetical protein KR200_000631 [Drosophila serrata]|nr:hypothetical protein KR200_000631 [Drosophila serrata]